MNSVAELAEELIGLQILFTMNVILAGTIFAVALSAGILARAIQASPKLIDRCNPAAVPQF